MNITLRKRNIFTTTIIISFITIVLSPLTANKADAFWITWDPGNFVPNSISAGTDIADVAKDYGLDAVAWSLANLVIERMTASTVNWINSGFHGSPAYITDPERYFQNMGDKVVGQFILTDPRLNFLCGPLQNRVRLALNRSYLDQDNRNWQCTLTDVRGNLDDFMNDFNNGGWENFFELTQRPQNNPIGAYLQAESTINRGIASKVTNKTNELLQGKGFLSYKTCKHWSPPGGESTNIGGIEIHTGAAYDIADIPKDDSGANRTCLEYEVSTPGDVIGNQLNKQLGLGGDKLAVADEFNEIVGALLNQAIGQIIGGIGRGLRGLSEPDPTTNNIIGCFDQSTNPNAPYYNPNWRSGDLSTCRNPKYGSLTDRLNTNDSTKGYFCLDQNTDPNKPNYDGNPNICKNPQSQDTGILDKPSPDIDAGAPNGNPDTPYDRQDRVPDNPECILDPDRVGCNPTP